MYGQLTYDADGNLVATLKLYTGAEDTIVQPELARLSVKDQFELIAEYDRHAAYEELSDDDQDELAADAAAILTRRIHAATGLNAYVNPANGHADLKSAVRRAFTPGGPGPLGFTFRLTA